MLVQSGWGICWHKPFFTSKATEVVQSETISSRPIRKNKQLLHDRITSREREIIQLLCEGKKNKEIASSLSISIKTVETHRSNVMRKLEIHNVSELVRYAVRRGLIGPDEGDRVMGEVQEGLRKRKPVAVKKAPAKKKKGPARR